MGERGKNLSGVAKAALFLLLTWAMFISHSVMLAPAAWADDGGHGDGGMGGGDMGGGGMDDGTGGTGGMGGKDGNDGHGAGNEGGYGDGEDDEHDRARRARLSGAVRPLREILAIVRHRYDGTVLDVHLEREKGHPVYRVRILDRRDRLRTLRIPAGGKRAHPARYNFRSRHGER